MSVLTHANAPTGARGAASTTAARTTTSGSTVVLFAACAADTFGATPVQDSKSNTWTLESTELSYDGSILMRCYRCKNITGGSGHTFTVTPGSNGFPALFMVEIGNVGTNPTITVDRKSDNASPFTSPSISPATAVTLIGCCFDDAPSGTDTHTHGGSFASGDKIEEITDADTSLTGSMAAVDKAAGTYNASVTSSNGGVTDTGVFIVSVETSGGSPTVYTKSISESIDVTENGTFKEWVINMFPETLSVADTLSDFLRRNRGQNESLTIADTLSRVALRTRAQSEALAVGDQLSASVLRGRCVLETVTIIDALTRVALLTRSLTEVVTVIDLLTKAVITGNVRALSITDGIAVIDQLNEYALHVRSVVETIVVLDQFGASAARSRVINEAFALLDLLTGLYVPYNPNAAVPQETGFVLGAEQVFVLGAEQVFVLGGYN